MSPGRSRAILLLLLIVGLFLRLMIAWLPISTQITLFLGDDAFYYFTIARNLVDGHAASVDGHTATNGFHPLWMLVCCVVFAAVRGQDLPIHIVLTVSAVFATATAYLIHRLSRMMFHRQWISLTLAGIYLLNPWVFVKQMDGLETSLAVFLQVAFLLTAWQGLRRGCTGMRSARLGLVAGLLVLSRTDLVLIAGPVLCLVFTQVAISEGRIARGLATFALVAAGVTLPWFLWNWMRFGQVVQVSGVALTPVLRQHFESVYGLPAGSIPGMAQRLVLLVRRLGHQVRESGISHFGLAGAGVFAAILWPRRRRTPEIAQSVLSSTRSRFLLVICGSAVLYLAVHELIRFSVRPWYYAHGGPAALLFLGFCLREIQVLMPLSAGRAARALLCAVMLLFGFSVYDFAGQRGYVWAAAMPEVARRIDALGLQDERVGAFNSGIFSYYASTPVTNLDGLVNPGAYEAIRRNRLLSYLCTERIGVLVDQDEYIMGRYDRFWTERSGEIRERLKLVEEVPSATEPFRIYRVGCPGRS